MLCFHFFCFFSSSWDLVQSSVSHIVMVPSMFPEAKRLPSGEKATDCAHARGVTTGANTFADPNLSKSALVETIITPL